MMPLENDAAALAYFRSPLAIRDRCGYLFDFALEDRLSHFRCHLERLDSVRDYVIDIIKNHYPNLDIPFHSRWRHFEVGKIPRLEWLQNKLTGLTPLEQAQAKFDLAIISVLLDAGAGAKWQYQEPETGLIWQRSEGLAIASYDMFCQGRFSSNQNQPFQVDANALIQLRESSLTEGFQITPENSLVGLPGRLKLLQSLGESLTHHPEFFGSENPRPGYLVNYLLRQAENNTLKASTILKAILEGLGEIWPGREQISGVNLGDVWRHSALTQLDPQYPLVPFHKLSQWLTYSLLEPLQEFGLEITGLDELTGLAEYRNGGLFLDLGVLELKDPDLAQKPHKPDSALIIEWRSLTLILLDKIAQQIRDKLNLTETDLPLVKVLQGGTWDAGRQIANQLRDGSPPLTLDSDGTVF